jgi:hypothetical protein
MDNLPRMTFLQLEEKTGLSLLLEGLDPTFSETEAYKKPLNMFGFFKMFVLLGNLNLHFRENSPDLQFICPLGLAISWNYMIRELW